MSALTAVSIPVILLAAPGVCGFVGHLADRRFDSDPFGVALGVIAGLIVAALRTRDVLRRMDTSSGGGKE